MSFMAANILLAVISISLMCLSIAVMRAFALNKWKPSTRNLAAALLAAMIVVLLSVGNEIEFSGLFEVAIGIVFYIALVMMVVFALRGLLIYKFEHDTPKSDTKSEQLNQGSLTLVK